MSLSKNKRRGGSMVEFAMLCPWYILLFVGAYDFGFYSYSLIAAENAVRVAALYCSATSSTATDSATACSYAIGQLRYMPNIGLSFASTCTSSPLVVTASAITGPAGGNATSVTVAYTTPQLMSIPGLLPRQITISRTLQMKLRS